MKNGKSQSVNEKHGMKKLNNQGLTLMEILVSIMILSIVGIVFLNSFVHAFRVNEMAKQKQYSTILAQSLMESIKAYDINSLDLQFLGDKGNFRVYSLGADGDKSLTMNGAESRTYSLTGITYQQSTFGERYKYDVDVLVEPTTKPITSQAQLVKAQGLNAYSDAIYTDSDSSQTALQAAIRTDLASHGHTGTVTTLDTTKLSATRTIQVNISSDDVVTVNTVYNYSANNYPITPAAGGGGGTPVPAASTASFTGTVNATENPIVCYDKTQIGDSNVQLINLYLYYYPAYKSSVNGMVGCTSDKIEIVNNSGTLENVYLIKQENPSYSVAEIDSAEGNYQPQVSVNSSSKLKLLHNLGTPLHSDTHMSPGITGNVEDMGEPWKEDQENTTLLYDVTVTVKKYQSPDHNGEVVCEIAGTTNTK